MPHPLSMTLLATGINSALLAQQAAGVLDLVGLAVGIWAVWSSITPPIGGNLQRAFRLIGFGALAFALSHVIESLIGSLQLLSDQDNFLLMQGTVLISMLFFVPGLAGLADVLPSLPTARRGVSLPHIWPLAVPMIFLVCAFSFIKGRVNPRALALGIEATSPRVLTSSNKCTILPLMCCTLTTE